MQHAARKEIHCEMDARCRITDTVFRIAARHCAVAGNPMTGWRMLTKKVARWIGVALVGGLLTAALAGCGGGGAKQDANVIKLGANSGDDRKQCALSGQSAANGAKLAIKEINAKGRHQRQAQLELRAEVITRAGG